MASQWKWSEPIRFKHGSPSIEDCRLSIDILSLFWLGFDVVESVVQLYSSGIEILSAWLRVLGSVALISKQRDLDACVNDHTAGLPPPKCSRVYVYMKTWM